MSKMKQYIAEVKEMVARQSLDAANYFYSLTRGDIDLLAKGNPEMQLVSRCLLELLEREKTGDVNRLLNGQTVSDILAHATVRDIQRSIEELRVTSFEHPVRCTACGETCESAEATRDEGYIYCPACVAAESKQS